MPFPQVHSLESFLRGNAHLDGHLQEGVNVLHALERHLTFIDLLDGAGLDAVHHPAEQSAVLEDLIEVVHVTGGVEVLLGDDLDPL